MAIPLKPEQHKVFCILFLKYPKQPRKEKMSIPISFLGENGMIVFFPCPRWYAELLLETEQRLGKMYLGFSTADRIQRETLICAKSSADLSNASFCAPQSSFHLLIAMGTAVIMRWRTKQEARIRQQLIHSDSC